MTEYGLNLFWKSLFARIATLERYGVQLILSEDAEDLTIRIPKRFVKMEFFQDAVNAKSLLLEAVRLREGYCVICGMDRAKHPSRKGRATNWEWGTLSVVEADCSSLLVYPMYCQSCWESRLMWRGIVEKKRRASREKAREENQDNESEPTLWDRRETAPDPDGDSGGSGMEVLSFTAD